MRSEDGRTRGPGKKEEREVQEEWPGRARRSGRAERAGRNNKSNGAPADQGKKLRRGRLIFRKEGMKGFIERLALWSDVVNSKDRQKAILP